MCLISALSLQERWSNKGALCLEEGDIWGWRIMKEEDQELESKQAGQQELGLHPN